MASSLWLAALSFATVQICLPAVAAQSTPPSSGLLADTGQAPPGAQKPPAPVITPEMRGDIFMAEKRYLEAAEMYRENSNGSAVMLNKTGIAYHQIPQQLNLAEKYYRLALRANPQYAEAVNNLGTIYYAKKSYRRAVNQYKKALRINDQSAAVWSNLGMGYFARKDYGHAAESFQRALMLDSEVFERRNTQGVLLQDRSVEEHAKFHYYLARVYAKAGVKDRALQNIRKALEEGYKEKNKMLADPAFAALKDLPEFKELVALEPRVL
jgi:tetratricopeptide (TPR) repeat protein